MAVVDQDESRIEQHQQEVLALNNVNDTITLTLAGNYNVMFIMERIIHL